MLCQNWATCKRTWKYRRRSRYGSRLSVDTFFYYSLLLLPVRLLFRLASAERRGPCPTRKVSTGPVMFVRGRGSEAFRFRIKRFRGGGATPLCTLSRKESTCGADGVALVICAALAANDEDVEEVAN